MKKIYKICLFIILIILIIYFNSVTKKSVYENMSNKFLHSGPNTYSPDNLNKLENLTKTDYSVRKSITGKFTEYGPNYSTNKYSNYYNACNCPPYNNKENDVKTINNIKQVYPKRLSTTAMFIDNGPIPNNEYHYDPFTKGCNCPKCL